MKKLCLILPFIMAASAFGEDPIETPPAGSPLRRAILDGFRASKPMQELSQGWHAKVVFTEVNIRRSGDWAWVSAVPTSEKDSTNKVEPNSAVMRKSQGQWAMVELVSDFDRRGGGSTQGISLLAFGIHEETSAMSGGDFSTELVTGVGVRLVAPTTPRSYSRAHHAVIRVYDDAGSVIETHEYKGDFGQCRDSGARLFASLPTPLPSL